MSNYSSYKEKELLLLAAKGDEKAFAVLFYQQKNKLFSFLYDLTHSTQQAEDVVQEVFLKIWVQRERLVEVENFNAYIFKMAHNYAIDQLRRYSRETLILLNLLFQNQLYQAQSPEDLLIEKELKAQIDQAINTLPAQQHKIFILRREQGLKAQEIANELNLSLSTVQNHLFRAIASIRERLQGRSAHSSVLITIALTSGSL